MKPKYSVIERAIFLGVVALVFLVPFAFAGNRLFLMSAIVCWVMLLAMLWLTGWVTGNIEPGPGLRRGAVPITLLVCWIAVVVVQLSPIPLDVARAIAPGSARAYHDASLAAQSPWTYISIERDETTQYLYLSIAYIGLIALILAVVKDGQTLASLCMCVVLSGSLQAGFGIAMHFAGAQYTLFFKEVSHQANVTGGFVNRNSLAAFLEIGLGCGVGLMVSQFGTGRVRSLKQRVRWLVDLMLGPKFRLRVLLVIMVLGLILTKSRMGNGAFFACTLIVGALGLLLMRNSGRAITAFLASMIAFDILVLGSWFGVDQVAKRIEETTISKGVKAGVDKGEESLQERGIPASTILPAWKEFPVFGSGSGTFSYLYPNYRPPDPPGFYEHAHNDYAEFLIEGGGVGFGALAALYAATLFAALRAMYVRSDQTRRGIAMGCVFSLVSIAMHQAVDMPLQIPANAVVMCVVVAMSWLCLVPGGSGRGYRHGREQRPSVDE